MKFLTDLVLKKSSSPINIKIPESVQVTEQDHLEALRNLEDNPVAMLRLIDLIFGPGAYLDNIPS